METRENVLEFKEHVWNRDDSSSLWEILFLPTKYTLTLTQHFYSTKADKVYSNRETIQFSNSIEIHIHPPS